MLARHVDRAAGDWAPGCLDAPGYAQRPLAPHLGIYERLAAPLERWGVADNMVVAWLLPFPAAAGTAGLVYAFMRVFGTGAAGPIIVAAVAVVAIAGAFGWRIRTRLVTPEARA